MYAVKALYDGVNFKPKHPITVSGKHEVVITFLEPITENPAVDESSKKRPLSELRGFLKGKVRMADDFNAPLEEMKEYMGMVTAWKAAGCLRRKMYGIAKRGIKFSLFLLPALIVITLSAVVAFGSEPFGVPGGNSYFVPIPTPTPVPRLYQYHIDPFEQVNMEEAAAALLELLENRYDYTPERIILFDVPLWDITWLLQEPEAHALRSELELLLDSMVDRSRTTPPFIYDGPTIIAGNEDGFSRVYSMITNEYLYSFDSTFDFYDGVLDHVRTMLLEPQINFVPLERFFDEWQVEAIRRLEEVFNLVGVFNYDDLVHSLGINYQETQMPVSFPPRFQPMLPHIQDNRIRTIKGVLP